MSVRLLAGPFTILDGSTNAAPSAVSNQSVWVPNRGMLVSATEGGKTALAIITYDGTLQFVSNGVPYGLAIGWSQDDNAGVVLDSTPSSPFTIGRWLFETIAMVAHDWETIGSTTSNPFGGYASFVEVNGKRYRLDVAGHLYSSPSNAWADAVEYTFGSPVYTSVGQGRNSVLGPNGKSREIFVADTFYLTGGFGFYDTISKSLNATFNAGERLYGAAYAPELDVVFALTGSGWKVFSLENVPSNVTAPVLQSGSTAPGALATYAVTVTDDAGQPCPGEYINWVLSGGSGTIVLIQDQTETDANGVATTTILFGIGATGAITLEADVVV